MELNITRFVTDDDMSTYSASQAELGPDAGKITWNAAKQEAAANPFLLTSDQIEEARAYFAGFGAWDDEEIAAWSDQEVNALVIQEIACRMRELENLCMNDDGEIDWQKVERLSERGTLSGCIYLGYNCEIYMYLGN